MKGIVRAFVQESNAGVYPKSANAAAHAQMDQIMADALGFDLDAAIHERRPFHIRVLAWFNSFYCPPTDSKNPNHLATIDDFLVCATPLASGIEFGRASPSNEECERLSNELSLEIMQDPNWTQQSIRTADEIDRLHGTDKLLRDLMKTVYALFTNNKYGNQIALLRSSHKSTDFGDDAFPDGVSHQVPHFSIAYVPKSETKHLVAFLRPVK